jgi:hypothetical protein
MSFGGISLAKCVPNPYGPLTAKIVCVASGGGNPSPQLQLALKTFLTERAVLDSIRVFVEDCIISPQNARLSVHCKTNYDANFVRDCIIWASRLYFSETSMMSINGIDFVTINAPAFPIMLDADAITTIGAITVELIT